MHEGKRLIPVFNKIGIRKTKEEAKNQTFLADIRYHTFQRMIYLYNMRFGD